MTVLPAAFLVLSLACAACAGTRSVRRQALDLAEAPLFAGEPSPLTFDDPEPSADDGPRAAAGDALPSAEKAGVGADDGWPDASEFLSKTYGFLPLVVPITEPAVGYGAAGGLLFLSEPLGGEAGFGRPNITAVGGFGTDNDSWGVLAGDVRYWLDDRLQTVAGVIKSSVNLDFHGVGDVLAGQPLRYNLEPEAGFLQGKYRLGDSTFWAGLSYAYARTEVSFDAPASARDLPEFSRISHVGGITPSLTWDTRDNVFTPTRGTYVEASVGLFAPAFGADDEFQRPRVYAMHFEPLGSQWFFGVRGTAAATFGDAPFYLQPFIDLRGVPKMRYQGETAADLEAELRWQFWNRLSLVGFGGVGAAWNDFEHVESEQSVTSGGLGFRYELARAYGIHLGIDVAFSEGDTAIYLQVGSAWARP